MITLQLQQSQSKAEFFARIVHLCMGSICFAACVWAAIYVHSPYSLLYGALMLLSLLPFWIGLYAQRKTVFLALFLGYWF